MIFHHVSFAILPDIEPWKSMPVGQGGIIGVPVLLQLGCIRWMNDGRWEIDCRDGSSRSDRTNMVFFGNHLLLASTVANCRGACPGLRTPTALNADFRGSAAKLKCRHEKHDALWSGRVQSSTLCSELDFHIGGKPVTLARSRCRTTLPWEVVAVLVMW
jgi:hypothetical protein